MSQLGHLSFDSLSHKHTKISLDFFRLLYLWGLQSIDDIILRIFNIFLDINDETMQGLSSHILLNSTLTAENDKKFNQTRLIKIQIKKPSG